MNPLGRPRSARHVDDERQTLARPEDWPFMPVNPLPMAVAPPVGWWAWIITERIRHSSFHRVREVVDRRTEDGPVTIIVGGCSAAWPIEQFAAAVPSGHRVLERSQDGQHAACSKCLDGGRTRRTYWNRLLDGEFA